MSNSNSSESKRPHRRLSLTQPTQISPNLDEKTALTAPNPEISAEKAALTAPKPALEPTGATPTVRVMAYLSGEEAQILDETWLKLRSHPTRPSKSDILRAACALAAQDFDTLTRILSEQHNSTLSRQRSSKLRKSE